MTASAGPAALSSLRLTRAAVALGLVLLLMLVLAGQAKAAAFGFATTPAPPGLSSNCQAGTGAERLKVTCTFGGAQNAVVSVGPNVSQANVRAVGHAGGRPSYNSRQYTTGGPGGLGGDVSGLINFAAGTGTLYVNVGELIWPQGDYINPWSFGGGAPAGACYAYICSWGYQPGGGGGASDVRTISAADAGTLESRLIVGGGGGGGGREGSPMGGGGAGGNAGEPGQGAGGSGGGGAGTADGGGSSGNGGAGSLGNGGGGGKVGSSDNTGGGGGGGSNLVPNGGTAVTSATPNASVSFAYERAPTSTRVSASAASSVYGSDITLTAAVRSDAGAPDGGTVQFYDGPTLLGDPQAVDPATGDATLTTRPLAGGERSLSASYSGDAGYAPGSSADTPLTHSVSADTSSTSLTVSAATSMYSTPATLTASVSATSGAPAAANGGQVQFYDGDNRLSGPVSVSGGQASLSLQGLLTAGEHTLHAVYEGDASTTTSVSSTVTHTTQREPTRPDLRSYSPSVNFGGSVMLEGSVRSAYGYQSLDQYLQRAGPGTDPGTVKLYDNGQLVTGGYQPPLYYGAGRLTFFATPQTGGTHDYTIKFSGNDAFEASESYSYGSRVQVVNVPSTTTLASTRTSSRLGQERTFSSQVTVADGTAPSGTVQFTDNGAPLGAAQPVGGDGRVSMTTSELGLGEHSIRAVYSPSGPYWLSSTSAPVAQPVAKLTTSTTATVTPADVQIGESFTLDAAITVEDAPATGPGSEVATGTVTFSDGRTELGSQPLGADGHAKLDIADGLAAGGHVITVAYSGDTNRAASSNDPTALFVRRVGTSVALTLPDTDGEQFTFRAELTPDANDSGATPTGDIAFYDGDTLLGRAPLTGASASSPGVAELQLPALTVGGHAIQAVYDGNAQFGGDRSSARSIVVSAPTPDPAPTSPVVPAVVPPVPAVVPMPPVVQVVPKPPLPTPALARSGLIEIMSERRARDGSFIRVRLHCDGSPKRRCVGTLALRVGTRNGVSRDYRLAGGQARSMRIRVPASLLARVRRDRAAPAHVVANPTPRADDRREPRSVRKRIVIVDSDD